MTEIDISPLEGQRSGWSFRVYVDGLRHDYGPYLSREEAEADREDLNKQRAPHKGPRPHAGQMPHLNVDLSQPGVARGVRRRQVVVRIAEPGIRDIESEAEELNNTSAPSARNRYQDRANVDEGQDREVQET
jgi:hypothetical protein